MEVNSLGIDVIRYYELHSLFLFANYLDVKINKLELFKSLQLHLVTFAAFEPKFGYVERFVLGKMFVERVMILTFLNSMQQDLDGKNVLELNYFIERAKESVTKIMRLRFNNRVRCDLAESYCLIGLLYNKINKFELSCESFKSSWLHWELHNSESATIHPCTFISSRYHAKALHQLKNFPESMQKFNELLESLSDYYKGTDNDSFADTNYELGKVHEEAGDLENALKRYIEVFLFYSKTNIDRSATIRIDINRIINLFVESLKLIPPFRLTHPETMCCDDKVLALIDRRLEILQLFPSYTTSEQKRLISFSARNLIAYREFRLNRNPTVNSLINLPFRTTLSPLGDISEEDEADLHSPEVEQKTGVNPKGLHGFYSRGQQPAAAQQRLVTLALTEYKGRPRKNFRN